MSNKYNSIKNTAIALSMAIALLPAVTLAAPKNFRELMYLLIGIVDAATLMLFAVALVIFFWNVLYNLWGYDGGSAEQKAKINTTLFWGVIIIFVMVSIWGIIRILQETLSSGLA